MAGLPEPYIPDINRTLANYNTGYALGQDQRKQNALTQAGEFMAKNDQTGARNALYSAGQMSEGLQIDDRMRAAARQAKDDQLAKAKRSNEIMGNMALLADTPEKWAVVIDNAKRAGLQVDNWADFGTRNYVLAQGGKVKEFLDMEINARAAREETARYDRNFNLQEQTALNARTNADRSFGLQERTFDASEAERKRNSDLQNRRLTEELDVKREAIAAKQAAAARPKPRALSFNDTQKLAEKGVQLENVDRYGQTFKDEFSGYGRGGESTMWIARNLPILTGPTTESASTWWQDYDRYKNVVRNELFGSALTEGEQRAFESADITPNMDPKQIRANLGRQKQAAESALAKTTRGLKASGYAPEAIEGAIGRPLDDLDGGNTPLPAGGFIATKKAAPGGQAAPVKVTTPEEAMKLPSGTSFVTPDGRVKVRP